MRTIKLEPLTVEAFAPFGSFTDVMNPSGPHLCGEFHTFYRDGARHFSDGQLPMGFSPLATKNHGYRVDSVEYHTHSCEGIMPINDDAVLHVTPAGGAPDTTATKAFLVPKGTIVSLYPGVYHLTPLPRHEAELHALVVLPERAYANDFALVELDEESAFEIEV